jgi:ribosomal protein S27E
MCPYCRSKNLISDKDELLEAERLAKAGQYEEAALAYEKIDRWDDARDCRKKSRKNKASSKIEMGKIAEVKVMCPHCSTAQPVNSKSEEIACTHCGTVFRIPEKVLELANFE